jgi:hypothetical protein
MRWGGMVLLWLAAVAAAPAQQGSEAARRLVLDASRALQAGNAARFLGYFDKRETPQFALLREDVLALLEIKTVGSSVDVIHNEIEGEVAKLEVDWLLQLTPTRELGAVEHRRKRLRVDVRVDGDSKIVLLDPVDFFSPLSSPEPAPAP